MMFKKFAIILIFSFLSCSFRAGAAQDISLARGQDLLTRGNYKEAIQVFTALVEKNNGDREARAGLARAQIETGDYAGARQTVGDPPADAALRLLSGELLFETGRYAEAAAEYERAAREARGALWLRARLGQARALRAQGKVNEAGALLQEFVGYYNNNQPRAAEELTLIARGLVLIEKYRDANDLFIDAREADPTYADAFVGQGELLNEKYNYGDAASLFRDALKINPNLTAAHLGHAETKNDSAPNAAEAALAINPNHVGALVMKGWLALEADNPEAATRSLDRAFQINPNAVDAMAVRAAIFYLQDRKAELEAETKKALAVNPRAGEFFNTLAHFATNNRRYADAVEFGRRAIELSPNLWAARTELGIQLLRVGRMAEGRAELERAFAGDPFNVWAKNTLDLLDSMKEYRDTVSGPFIIRIAPRESDALAVYTAELLQEAHKRFTAKYRFTPRAPIAVELFPNHEDFAVRSLGLPGLGALGVCFGQVVTMDSPSARPAGEFNWGTTLWHEYMHVISLQITNNRIPRWFSEGLSVYEERRAYPGWGDKWSLERLKAYKDGRFVKIADLDSAFLRPKSPDQVPLAYFQASLVCDFIDEKVGFDAILKMLAMYKEGAKTPDVLKRALNLSEADFDRAFNEWVRGKVGGYLEAVGDGPAAAPGDKTALAALVKSRPSYYFAHLKLGALYKAEGDADRAIEHLRRAIELFPYYAGEGNPYALLADIHQGRGQKKEAAAALDTLTRYDETSPEALKWLAQLRLELGEPQAALDALEKSFYITPFDADLHKLAGDVYLEKGDAARAVREHRVCVALNPPDLAGAHYDLARALEASGNRAEARRAVLRSLEIAPGFDKAQELLLRLRGGS